MKRLHAGAIAAVLLTTAYVSSAVLAQDAEMDPAVRAAAEARIGNTIIATDADGTQTHIYWRANGSFSAWRADWKSEGTWFARDGKLCLKYDVARPGMGMEECMTPSVHKPGDRWGNSGRTVTMVEGWQ